MAKSEKDKIPREKQDPFELELGSQIIQNTVTHVNSVLGQLLTFNATLLCGSTIFFANDIDFLKVYVTCKKLAILFFFFATVIAFLGVLPYNCSFDPEDAEEIKEARRAAAAHKKDFIKYTGMLDLAGFLSLMVGIFL